MEKTVLIKRDVKKLLDDKLAQKIKKDLPNIIRGDNNSYDTLDSQGISKSTVGSDDGDAEGGGD